MDMSVFADIINQIGMPLIAVLVPLAVAAIRKVVPNIPKLMLPILAVLIGPLFDVGLSLISGVEAIGWQAALLGLAGVGLREMKKQVGAVFTA